MTEFWQGIIRVVIGAVLGASLTVLGSIATETLRSRKEERLAARKAVGTAARRLSRIRSLAQTGSQLTEDRPEQVAMSHACADEFDELSIILLSGPKQPPADAEELMQEARSQCARWKVLAARLCDGDEQKKKDRSIKIGELTARTSTIARQMGPIVRTVWRVR